MFETTVRKTHRILDFDSENRPLSYWYGDATTGELTAIAWAWYDGDEAITSYFLDPPPVHEESFVLMLKKFKQVYDEADMVTGHYIRRHDLPIINSAMIEYRLPTLGPKMTCDTKEDLIRHGQLSASQMSLAGMLDVTAPKPRMTQGRWRDANRLTPEGKEAAKERVEGDVLQHMELRRAMIADGLLHPPRVWTP